MVALHIDTDESFLVILKQRKLLILYFHFQKSNLNHFKKPQKLRCDNGHKHSDLCGE